MKKTYLLLCLTFLFGISVKTSAQIAPDDVNLRHQWTFDDGTTKDSKGTVDGVLEGAAIVKNKALNTASGGFLSLSGADLAVNAYTELTTEVWFTSTLGANTSYHMLYYFGETNTGGGGENYTCITPARGNNVSRAMLSTGTGGSGGENGVDGPEYDDGILHHMVSVISETSITFYIDGVNMGAADLRVGNSIAGIGTQFAYFAKGGYRNDPIWKGSIHKISVYDKALTDDNILYLFQHGAEEQPVISTSVASFAFDENYPAEMITVTAANLTEPITITAPAGITVQPTTLPAGSLNADLTVIYDGSTTVDGDITFTSGTTVANVPVKTASDATCFVPLYPNNVNIISDAGMNSLTTFAGWGYKDIVTINTDPTNVYCGASSIKIGSGADGITGSLDVPLNGLLLPNTTYRVKVMAKTFGDFQLGIERIDLNNSANNVIIKPINTNGEWQMVDFFFATGDLVADNPVIYINDWNHVAANGYFDNWELYATPDPVITPTATALAFDPQFLSGSFNVTAANLTSDIIITAPAGITVEPATLPANSASAMVSVTYDGTTAVNGNITLVSGAASASVLMKSAGSNTTCFTPLYTDRPNLIPDPFFNSMSNFNGWESHDLISIINKPDSVYCGSRSGKITNRGDFEVPLAGQLVPNYTYISRIMLRTFGGAFKMGINRHDTAYSGDFTDSIDTYGEWKEYTFQFNTGAGVGETPVIFFNNDRVQGKVAFLDNWELYKKDSVTAVVNVKDMFSNLYVQNGKIVADFDLNHAASVQLSVYNIQGALISDEKMTGIAGRNRKVMSAVLPSGMYIVKMTKNGESSFRKLIK